MARWSLGNPLIQLVEAQLRVRGGLCGFLLPDQLWGRSAEAGVNRTVWVVLPQTTAPDLPEAVCEVLLTWSTWQKNENNPPCS